MRNVEWEGEDMPASSCTSCSSIVQPHVASSPPTNAAMAGGAFFQLGGITCTRRQRPSQDLSLSCTKISPFAAEET